MERQFLQLYCTRLSRTRCAKHDGRFFIGFQFRNSQISEPPIEERIFIYENKFHVGKIMSSEASPSVNPGTYRPRENEELKTNRSWLSDF